MGVAYMGKDETVNKKVIVSKRIIKFILFLIIAKLVYLALESYYNGLLLDTVTRFGIGKQSFIDLEHLGHKLTSFGLTLLLMPLFYWLSTLKIHKITSPIIFIALTIGSTYGIYQGLTKLMDYLVAQQSNKRYESYYVTAFKYGILSQQMGYEKFIPKENLKHPSIEDKVLLANMFLLTHIDTELLHNLFNIGKPYFLDVFIQQFGENELKTTRKELLNTAVKINNGWEELQAKKKKIKENFDNSNIKRKVIGDYRTFEDSLYQKYKDYLKSEDEYKQYLNANLSKTDLLYEKLRKYFRYQKYQQARDKYAQEMYSNFGRYIEPSVWCDILGGCPSKDAIEREITSEASKQWYLRSHGIPLGLGQIPFYKNMIVKKQVIEELAKKGLYVNDSFNYSFKQFQEAYYAQANKEEKNSIRALEEKFMLKAGAKINLNMSYEKYLDLFKPRLAQKFTNPKILNAAMKMIKTGDMTNFYTEIFRPMVYDKFFKRYFLTKKDFDKKENYERGDAAIKMLYIPPFALFMSLFAASMNLITVFTSIITLPLIAFSWQAKLKKILIASMLTVLMIAPYIYSNEHNFLREREIFKEQHFNGFLSYYTKVLTWTIPMETINYNYIYPITKKLNPMVKLVFLYKK